MTGHHAPPPTPILEVAILRRTMADAGFPPVTLRTGGKEPTEKGWPQKARETRTAADVGPPTTDALNTGFATFGLRIIDIDVDDDALAMRMRSLAEMMLGTTIVRTRSGTSRAALVYRAAEGEPGKRTIVGMSHRSQGPSCKIEVLGNGQQLHAFGRHPSGAEPVWSQRPGLDIRRDDVPAVTETQADAFLVAAALLIGAPPPGSFTTVVPAAGRGPVGGALAGATIPAAFLSRTDLPDMNTAASAGLERSWVDHLPNTRKDALLQRILFYPGIHEIADQPRDMWLSVLAACSDFGRRGAAQAYHLAKGWSSTSKRFNPATFDRDWGSLGPRPGGATVGKLLYLAEQHGFDLGPWREEARMAASLVISLPTPATFARPVSPLAIDWDMPRWIVPGLLQRGALTVLAAAGAGGKTTLAVGLAAAATGGRNQWGPFSIVQLPGGLRVLYVGAEESFGRISALAMGACRAQGFSSAEVKAVLAGFTVHDARQSGLRLGAPPADSRDPIAQEAQDAGLAQLAAAVEALRPDVIVLDTAAALLALPNENDNILVTALLGRLTRLAARFNAAIMVLHHTPKLNRDTAAALRGDAMLVRGGSAWTNTARVAWASTIAQGSDAAPFLGIVAPGALRVLDPVKVNDMQAPPPAFFTTISVLLGKTGATVRAVEWVQLPASGGAGSVAAGAIRCAVLAAVQAGAKDSRGATVPLSPGGKRDGRSAILGIARVLMQHDPRLDQKQAEGTARGLLGEFQAAGIVTVGKVPVPKYKPNGAPNGTQERDGLVAHPQRAPWWTSSSVQAPTNPSPAVGAPVPPPASAPAPASAGSTSP